MKSKVATHSICLILLLCVAVIIISPELVYGYPDGHSAEYNVPWLHFFFEQFRGGELYPRWLTDFPLGQGSPVFYFYPPAPFYLASSLSVFCWGCQSQALLTVTHLAILAFSGWAFYAYLLRFATPLTSLAIAILYQLLPYHYLDLEVRNAIGESFAYVWLPLFFLALTYITESTRAIVFAAFAYAGLIYSHLPSALLMSPFAAVFLLFCSSREARLRNLVRLVMAGLLGAMLAAPYLASSLGLTQYLPNDAWAYIHDYYPENWLLPSGYGFSVWGRRVYHGFLFTTLLAVGTVLFLTVFYKNRLSIAQMDTGRRRLLFAAFTSLVICWLLMSDVAELLWVHVTPLRQVQFPWRLGVIVDFSAAVVVGVCISYLFERSRTGNSHLVDRTFFLTTAVLLFSCGLMMMKNAYEQRYVYTRATWQDKDPATCCLPPNEYRLKSNLESDIYKNEFLGKGDPYRDFAAYVATLPEISSSRDLAELESISIKKIEPSAFIVSSQLQRPATVVIRQSFFPTWQLTNTSTGTEVSLRPSPRAGLIEADLKPGQNRYRLSLTVLPVQQLGSTVGLVGLIVSLLLLMIRPQLRHHLKW